MKRCLPALLRACGSLQSDLMRAVHLECQFHG